MAHGGEKVTFCLGRLLGPSPSFLKRNRTLGDGFFEQLLAALLIVYIRC
jgi:hypothetical protein